MAKETKVGLLIGLALILLVGIILSDLVSGPEPDAMAQDQAAGFGPQAQSGIYAAPETDTPAPRHPRSADRPTVLDRGNAAPVPNAFQTQPAFGQSPEATRAASPAPVRILPSAQPAPGLAPRLSPPPTRRPDLPETQTREAAAPVAAELPQAWRVDRAVSATTAPTPTRDPAVSATPDDNSFFIPPPEADLGSDRFHVVGLRDSLTAVARKHYGDPNYATGLAQANPGRVGFGGTLHPGDRLVLPPLDSPFFASSTAAPADPIAPPPALPQRPATPAAASSPAPEPIDTITVAANDTLSGLAARHLGSSQLWDELLSANRNVLQRPEALREGMVLRLPTAPANPAAPAATGALTPAPAFAAAPAAAKTYTVKAGDNLTRIATRALGDGQRWDEIFAANRNQLDNPASIRVGMVLALPGPAAAGTPAPALPRTPAPAPAGPRTYTVKSGDTLTRIATRTLGNGQRWDEIFDANRATLDAPESIRVGQELILP